MTSEQRHSRNLYLRRTYNITLAEYEAIRAYQGGRCYICRRPSSKLVVDHDHVSGMVRGLLCPLRCNHGLLGRRDQDPGLFDRAAEYLRNPPAVAVVGVRMSPLRPDARKPAARARKP